MFRCIRPHAQALLAAMIITGNVVLPGHAQTIERMRLTDNDLSCQQMYDEIQQMDTRIALVGAQPAATPMAAPAPVPAAPSAASGFAAGLLGGVNAAAGAVPAGLMPNQAGIPAGVMADPQVQASIARARAAGYSDAQIQATLQLGAARTGYPVGAALAAQRQAAPAAPNPAPVAVQAAPALAAAAMPSLATQARARKEHLTSLFLGKGCKMADIQK